MGGLQLLPGEKEELRIHPAPASLVRPRLMALGFALLGGLLWTLFHAPSWTSHTPSDWTAAWTWLWGTPAAVYLWTAASLVAAGALLSLPRGPLAPLRLAALAAILVCLAGLAMGRDPAVTVPLATAALSIPALTWLELRRLATHYHVTTLRLVRRTTLPTRTEASILYSDLVDLDARASPWPDTGTLIPVVAKRPPGDPAAVPFVMVGVRPFRRVKAAVELLARKATAPEGGPGLDRDVAEALAALHRR